MKVKPFDLYERVEHRVLSVLAGGEKERSLRRHCGHLGRGANGRHDWFSNALNGLKVESALISPSRRRALEDGLEISQNMDLDRIVRYHQSLFDLLENLVPGGWKVQYRSETSRRLLIPQGVEPTLNRFDFLGVLVSLDLDGSGQALEIGEGGVRIGQINLDGLCRRIEDLVKNHAKPRAVTFAGPVDLVLTPGDGAILFHEIAGHALEADHWAQRRSPLCRAQIGDQVASELLTLTSGDPRDPFFGDIGCDDEGEVHRDLELIKKGNLSATMGDSFYQTEIEGCQKGFARCSDYTQVPQPRMFGMFVGEGETHPDEIIAKVKRGILAREFGHGTAMLERDRFQFRILSAFLIEDGKVTAPLGMVDVFGSIRDTLLGVVAVGNDFRFDRGMSYCVKNRQTVHVRVGQPTVHIRGVGARPLLGS